MLDMVPQHDSFEITYRHTCEDYYHVGATPAASVRKLYDWLDTVVGAVVADETSHVKRTVAGTRIKGYYHRLKQNQHSRLEGIFGRYNQWGRACEAAGISAGTYISIEGAGKGNCELISKILGPFLDA